MKIFPTLLLLLITFQSFSQNYPITGINISLPASPDANTANWGSGTSMFVVTANSKPVNGRVDGFVVESKILVTIKKSGAKVCGSYTGNTAPTSNFNTLNKVWSGTNAIALLGQECTLPPGDYEICVQFFGYGAAGVAPLSEEKTKAFSIRAIEQQVYQAPQAIAPADGALLSETELQKPILFRWIPVIPRAQDPVTYRLKVWQLMQGQTGTQAMKVNQPLITKDVDNITQAVVNNLVGGPCLPPYMCDFIWNVQALNREGKPIGENNGTGKPFQFSARRCDVNLVLRLKSVECLSATNGNNIYKICLSAVYNSPDYNLTYSISGSGFKTYSPSNTISQLTPVLQVQNSGSATTVDYCFNVTVPSAQTALKIGLQGDDNDSGPIVCQPGADLEIKLPECSAVCDCGVWSPTVINRVIYDCGSKMLIPAKCNQPINFVSSCFCRPNDSICRAKVRWEIKMADGSIQSGSGNNGSFTPTTNGMYTIILNADCGAIKCPSCIYTLVVTDCMSCDCGNWSNSVINIQSVETTVSKIKCDETVSLAKGTYSFLIPDFACNPKDSSCIVTYEWLVQGIASGSGTGQVFRFNFNLAGIYTVSITPLCGGKRCIPCKIIIKADEIRPPTDVPKSLADQKCENYSFELRKIYRGDSIAYEGSFTNKYSGSESKYNPKNFRINIRNNSVIGIDSKAPKEWNRTPSKFPPGSSQIKWTNNSGDIPQGETKLGTLYFAVPTSNPYYVIYDWLNKEGEILCKDSIKLIDTRFYYNLDKEPSYTYTEISNSILRVQFSNPYASVENIQLTVYDVGAKKIKRKSKDVIRLNSITGLNRISIDIKDYNLEPDRFYLLTISDFHSTFHFNFKVTNDREK